MKKIVAILVIVVALCSGCALATQFKKGVDAVDQKVCPTIETGKEALEASSFLWPLVSTNPTLYAAYLVFDNFSNGACYLASQLAKALEDYDKAQPITTAVGRQAPALTELRKVVQKK